MDEDTPEVAKIQSLQIGSSLFEIGLVGGKIAKSVLVKSTPLLTEILEDANGSSSSMFDELDMDFLNSMVIYPCDCYGKLSDEVVNDIPVPKISQDLGPMVMHLNDGHKWTRERIADWLDELHDSGVVNIIVEEKK